MSIKENQRRKLWTIRIKEKNRDIYLLSSGNGYTTSLRNCAIYDDHYNAKIDCTEKDEKPYRIYADLYKV